MGNKSFNDDLIDFAAELKLLEQEMADVSDHGDVTGFCQEQHSIRNDAANTFNGLRIRVDNLRYRLSKWKAQQAKTKAGSDRNN